MPSTNASRARGVRTVRETGCPAVSLNRQYPPFGSGRLWEVEITGEHQPDLALLPHPTREEPHAFDPSRQHDPDYIAEYAAEATRRMYVRADPVARVTFIRTIQTTP